MTKPGHENDTRTVPHPDPMMALAGETFHWVNMDPEPEETCACCGKHTKHLKAFYFERGGRRRPTHGLYCNQRCWRNVNTNT